MTPLLITHGPYTGSPFNWDPIADTTIDLLEPGFALMLRPIELERGLP